MILPIGLRCGLDSAFVRLRFLSSFCVFLFFFFFSFPATVFDQVFHEQYIRALFMGLTNYSNFFIKNRFHSTIYTFKNYFATVFYISVFSFSTVSKWTSQNYIFIHKDSYCLPHRKHDSFLLKEPLSRLKWLKEYIPTRLYKSIRMQHKSSVKMKV